MRSKIAFTLASVAAAASTGAQGIVSDAEELAKLMPGYRLASYTQISDAVAHILLLKEVIDLPEQPGRQGGGQVGSRTAAEEIYPPLPTRPVALELFAVDPSLDITVEDLPWGDDPRPDWHTELVDMGTWRGHRWFADAVIPIQEYIRGKLGFEGGDDRIPLLIKGLGIEDSGTMTRNSSVSQLAAFGEEALPYLEQAIDATREQVSRSALRTLGKIQGDRSTKILLEHSNGENPKLASAAAYGLIHKPYRQQAKEAYRQMVVDQYYLQHVAEMVAEFQWNDFAPELSAVLEDAKNLHAYTTAYNALRSLEGRNAAESLKNAAQSVRRTAFMANRAEIDFEEELRVFLKSPDVEAATLFAIALSGYVTKGVVTRINAFGLSVLDQLPRERVLEVMHRLDSSLRDERDKEAVRSLLSRWKD